MRYKWDTRKNRRNLLIHGITFEDAVTIFDGPTLETIDDRFDYGETRIYAVGIAHSLEIVVIYADVDEGERRVISARRAERHEREAYWKSIG